MEVDVLRMLRYCRMSGTVISRKALRNRSPEPKRSYSALIKMDLTNPCPIKIYGDKRRWDGEVVHKRVELQHEPKLVRGSDELKNRYNVEDEARSVLLCVTRIKK